MNGTVGGHRARPASGAAHRLRRGGPAALALLAACGGNSTPLPLDIGLLEVPTALLVWVAEWEGLLDEVGLDADVRTFSTSAEVLGALRTGAVDVVVVTATDLGAHAAADSLRILASVGASDDAAAIVARRDHGIGSWADLRGRRVGVPPSTSFWRGADVMLGHAGLSRDAWTPVPLPFEALADALLDGRVDAVVVGEPIVARLRAALGDDATVLRAAGLFRQSALLVTQAATLDSLSDALQRLVGGLVEAEELLAGSPEVLPDAAAGLVGDGGAFSTERLLLRVSFPAGLVRTIEERRRWAASRGLLPGGDLTPVRDMMDPTVLGNVRPESVMEAW